MHEYTDPSLPRKIEGWTSSALGIPMPIVTYGHYGKPLLLFPTAAADFLENERFFLIRSIEPAIMEGRIKVFSIESINRHAWMNPELSTAEQVRRQELYSRYVEEEVVGYIRDSVKSQDARIAVSGASFGAFHAANALFRRPDLFDTLIGMSGFYDLGPDYLRGFSSDAAYFNNPMAFVANLEGPILETLRSRCTINLVTGQGEWEDPSATIRFSELLSRKGIDHVRDLWGHDVSHDWPWWRKMLPHYIRLMGW